MRFLRFVHLHGESRMLQHMLLAQMLQKHLERAISIGRDALEKRTGVRHAVVSTIAAHECYPRLSISKPTRLQWL